MQRHDHWAYVWECLGPDLTPPAVARERLETFDTIEDALEYIYRWDRGEATTEWLQKLVGRPTLEQALEAARERVP